MKRLLLAFVAFLLMVVATRAWRQNPPPTQYDWKSGRTLSQYVIVPNEPDTGTELYHMASPIVVSGEVHAIKTAVGQSNALGVCVYGCGTTGKAVVMVVGQTWCDFDGPTTANNFSQNSTTTEGHCTDVGSTRPTRGKVIGRIGKTYGSGGIHEIILFGIGVQGGFQGIVASSTLDFPEIVSGNSCDDLTLSVPGAVAGDPVALGTPVNLPARSSFFAFVSAPDVVSVRHCANGGSPNPSSGTYQVRVHK